VVCQRKRWCFSRKERGVIPSWKGGQDDPGKGKRKKCRKKRSGVNDRRKNRSIRRKKKPIAGIKRRGGIFIQKEERKRSLEGGGHDVDRNLGGRRERKVHHPGRGKKERENLTERVTVVSQRSTRIYSRREKNDG